MDKQIEINFDEAKCTFFGNLPVGFDVAQSQLIVMDGPDYVSDDANLWDTNLTAKVQVNVPMGISSAQLMGQCMSDLNTNRCFVVCNGKEYPAKRIYIEYGDGKLSLNFYASRDRLKSGAREPQVEK